MIEKMNDKKDSVKKESVHCTVFKIDRKHHPNFELEGSKLYGLTL